LYRVANRTKGTNVDATAWVGIAGIAGTLAGTMLSPLVGERVRSRAARREQIMTHRQVTYADVLRVSAKVQDRVNRVLNFEISGPVDKTDVEELERVLAQIRVIGTDRVYASFTALAARAGEFYESRRGMPQSAPDMPRLGQLADRLREAYTDLESAVRLEMRS
jgi:hypothetical protein